MTNTAKVRQAPGPQAELDISQMNPDADGDGNVTLMEREIYNALKAADVDNSGSIGVGELYKVIGDLVGEKRKSKNLTRLIFALLIVIVLALASIFTVSLAAGEALKESHVKGAEMKSLTGQPVRVDTVESTATLWDIPAVETDKLAKMKFVTFYADLSSMAGVNSWTEATFQIGGVYKASDDVAHLMANSGERVTIRRAAKTGDVVIDGATYPISDKCEGPCVEGSRRLSVDDRQETVTFTPAVPSVAENRRNLRRGRGGFLSTQGSFTLSSGGGGEGGGGQ